MHHGGKRAWLAIVIAATVAASFAGCDDDSEQPRESAAAGQDQPARSTEPAPEPAGKDRASRPDMPEGDAATDSAPPPAESGDQGADSPEPSGDPTDNAAAQRAEVAQTVERMYHDMAAGDGAGVCAVMSERASEQIAQQVPGGSTETPGDRTCAASLDALLRAGASSGAFAAMANASVSKVRLANKLATATVSFGGSSTGNIRLLRENGEWRFGVGAVTTP